MRFALHVLTGRREDCCSITRSAAKMFGYEDATYTLAVEQFMQRYYRTVMDVSLLNEMLLQLFREGDPDRHDQRAGADQRAFQIRNDYLESPPTRSSRGSRPRSWRCSRSCSITRSCAACARRPSARSAGICG